MNFANRFAQLQARKNQALFRQIQVNDAPTGRTFECNRQRYLNFSSNDYLGLAAHPLVIKAYQQGAASYGVGSGGSPLVTGFQRPHAILIEQLCDWLDRPAAILLNSGFAANQLALKTLLGKGDLVVQDKLNHASLIDAALSTAATSQRFLHNQPQSLAARLQRSVASNRLVVTEGIFSMDGDAAPIAPIKAICQQQNAWLMVDDAHGLGVRGVQGRGSCAVAQINPDLLMATFGKALGVGGAMLSGSIELMELFTNLGREFIYSTAMPAAQACAVSAAIKLVRTTDLPQILIARIEQFKTLMQQTSWRLLPSDSAIQPLWVGQASTALALSSSLREHGFWVSAIRPPTVPAGQARLRITLTAAHTKDDITRLVKALSCLASVFNEANHGHH
ncbi:8-amino-7-oxononanoate synthase [Celerinatantimonas yamalensis]